VYEGVCCVYVVVCMRCVLCVRGCVYEGVFIRLGDVCVGTVEVVETAFFDNFGRHFFGFSVVTRVSFQFVRKSREENVENVLGRSESGVRLARKRKANFR